MPRASARLDSTAKFLRDVDCQDYKHLVSITARDVNPSFQFEHDSDKLMSLAFSRRKQHIPLFWLFNLYIIIGFSTLLASQTQLKIPFNTFHVENMKTMISIQSCIKFGNNIGQLMCGFFIRTLTQPSFLHSLLSTSAISTETPSFLNVTLKQYFSFSLWSLVQLAQIFKTIWSWIKSCTSVLDGKSSGCWLYPRYPFRQGAILGSQWPVRWVRSKIQPEFRDVLGGLFRKGKKHLLEVKLNNFIH